MPISRTTTPGLFMSWYVLQMCLNSTSQQSSPKAIGQLLRVLCFEVLTLIQWKVFCSFAGLGFSQFQCGQDFIFQTSLLCVSQHDGQIWQRFQPVVQSLSIQHNEGCYRGLPNRADRSWSLCAEASSTGCALQHSSGTLDPDRGIASTLQSNSSSRKFLS